jgi:hypothetical protein
MPMMHVSDRSDDSGRRREFCPRLPDAMRLTRRATAALTALAVLTLAASAALAVPTRLRYRYDPAKPVAYRMNMTQSAGTMKLLTQVQMTQKAEKLLADGGAELALSMDTVKMESDAKVPALAENLANVARGMTGGVLRFTMSSRGQMLKYTGTSGLSPQLAQIFDGIQQSLQQIMPLLPEEPVDVGSTWDSQFSTSVSLPGAGGGSAMAMKGTVHSVLRSFGRAGKHRLANIETSFKIEIGPSQLMGVTVAGSGTGTGAQVFDIDAGAIERASSTAIVDTKVQPAQGDAQVQQSKAASEMVRLR